MSVCSICPRKCSVDRSKALGVCSVGNHFVLARAAKHFWEEPCISGKKGSGTVFFSGCNLKCVYCQNYKISHDCYGKQVSDFQLMEIFDRLIESGAHNINLVNPTHYADRLANVLSEYKSSVPIVYNSSGYESVDTLKKLEGLVDIYLPDLKYINSEKAKKYSNAPDYFPVAAKAIIEMRRQIPRDIFAQDGMMKKGLIIRHLILPMNTNQTLKILSWIKENLGTDTTVSIMSQYTPCGKIESFKELGRKITRREYEKVVEETINLGFHNAYIQQLEAASEDFIPDFDLTGVTH